MLIKPLSHLMKCGFNPNEILSGGYRELFPVAHYPISCATLAHCVTRLTNPNLSPRELGIAMVLHHYGSTVLLGDGEYVDIGVVAVPSENPSQTIQELREAGYSGRPTDAALKETNRAMIKKLLSVEGYIL